MDRGTAIRSLWLAFVFAIVASVAALAGWTGVAGAGVVSTRQEPATESPLEIATRILGHAPRGLAKSIVERGSILVALLDYSLRHLQRDGVIRESMTRWFGPGDQGIRP